MSRALGVLAAAGWWTAALATLAWWLPSIALVVGAVLLDRARFALAIGLGRALAGVGLTDTARAVFAAEGRRAERRMAALRARRGW